ncbi:MFS general substrate transporter [Aaosphaeria arxii CBS 175.79]|uniref:MFS general substrate transporter n=1 Tax=Aaosphaeria arxii CBS 175.79 TaxID=1450172 RepID=A0A6A5XJ68_9PLEO|nr:MFS general substrate transporter [Aaosphaeria arxii CBS 175.79]KAF2012909.1 MFS general substrate transporter [Aaosphaeria arxii CBS 175.79]
MTTKTSTEFVEQVDITLQPVAVEAANGASRRENKLRTKIDLFVVPTVALLYLMCFIDRANIGNARLAGFEKDLKLEGYDYNIVLSIFYISYILFEIPATICCKLIGPGWFLPATTLGFGIVSIATAFVRTRAQACAVRFLLGVFEAGLMPGIAYYLSRWYRRSELAFRLGLYMTMAPLSGAFGGLLASGILKLSHFGGLHRWEMIFAVEGIITVGIAIIAFGTLTDRPDTARWLSEAEKELAVDRVKSERLAQAVLLDKIDGTKLRRGFTNPITIATSCIFMLNNITVLSISFFLPSIIKTIYPGRSTVQMQLLTVPPYIVGAFFVLLIPTLSWKFDHRQLFLAVTGPTAIAGFVILLATINANVRYGAIFLTASTAFTLGAMCNAQVSANVLSDSARSIAIGTNVMFGNLGGLIATWTYLPTDVPMYRIGNSLNLTCAVLWTTVAILAYFWMKSDNRKREVVHAEAHENLEHLSREEIQDLEWKHPDWRWKI